jgi:MFS family permease
MADQPTSSNPAPGAAHAGSGMTLRRYSTLVAGGAFATTFAQMRILALYPTTFLLKEHFHMKQEQVAVFFFWATFAWNVKPLAGLLADAFPLFGTRRRHYMMLGAAFAGVFWILLGASANNYTLLFTFAIAVNVATVFASTVMGGLMVEAGQAFGAPGRISSLRQFVQSISQIIAPLLGGYLAGKAYGLTTGIAAATVIMLAILTFALLRERPLVAAAPAPGEPPLERPHYRMSAGTIVVGLVLIAAATWLFNLPDGRNIGVSLFALLGVFALIILLIFLRTSNAVIVRAQGQLVHIFQSRTLWMAAAMLFLVFVVPGLYTALIYQQTDVLKFSKQFIGSMASLEAGFGVLAAVVYGFICRRFNLRTLIIGAVGLNAACTLLYLVYNHQTAPMVHIVTGFTVIMSELALMDLAVRSTPRGCEALGFALMMSMRNFGIGMSDVLATKLIDQFHFPFNSLVLVNAGTTAVILLFIPLLPALIVGGRDGD